MTHESNLHDIINENTIIYQIDRRVEFTNIAAIFKSYANLINSKEYMNLKELKNNSTQFIKGLKGNPISKNYPIVANENEIYMVNRLIVGLINYIDEKDIKPANFQRCINRAIKVYITEIMYYE